jgi:hypothetical protein
VSNIGALTQKEVRLCPDCWHARHHQSGCQHVHSHGDGCTCRGWQITRARGCGHVAYRDHMHDCIDEECTNAAYQVVGAEQCECHAGTVVGGKVRCLLFAGHKKPHHYPVGIKLVTAQHRYPPNFIRVVR